MPYVKRRSTEDMFWAKVKKGPLQWDCWEWTACKNSAGYGRFNPQPHTIQAHRYSYELAKGPIPQGYHIDHLCRNRGCVNPDHLEAVTPEENSRRNGGVKTHCLRGHEYTPENTYYNDNRRSCKTCRRQAAADFRAKQ